MASFVRPSTSIIDEVDGITMLKSIEAAGRTCYKSEEMISETSAIMFVRNIIERGHESVIEHEKISVRVICDRGVSHEIIRHRLASYSQESTRYCNYKGGVEFIIPTWVEMEEGIYQDNDNRMDCTNSPVWIWFCHCTDSELRYKLLLEDGWSPQMARSILPNSLKTEIVITMNLREWRHFFKLRTAKASHPQMREVAIEIYHKMNKMIPVIFNGIYTGE